MQNVPSILLKHILKKINSRQNKRYLLLKTERPYCVKSTREIRDISRKL